MTINTKDYELSTMGKTPRGYGFWNFADKCNYDLDGNTKFFTFNGTYTEAKKAAIKWGKENGLSTVYVLG